MIFLLKLLNINCYKKYFFLFCIVLAGSLLLIVYNILLDTFLLYLMYLLVYNFKYFLSLCFYIILTLIYLYLKKISIRKVFYSLIFIQIFSIFVLILFKGYFVLNTCVCQFITIDSLNKIFPISYCENSSSKKTIYFSIVLGVTFITFGSLYFYKDKQYNDLKNQKDFFYKLITEKKVEKSFKFSEEEISKINNVLSLNFENLKNNHKTYFISKRSEDLLAISGHNTYICLNSFQKGVGYVKKHSYMYDDTVFGSLVRVVSACFGIYIPDFSPLNISNCFLDLCDFIMQNSKIFSNPKEGDFNELDHTDFASPLIISIEEESK